jgi:hypothetical protein
MANIYTNIDSNKRETWVIMALYMVIRRLVGLSEYFSGSV